VRENHFSNSAVAATSGAPGKGSLVSGQHDGLRRPPRPTPTDPAARLGHGAHAALPLDRYACPPWALRAEPSSAQPWPLRTQPRATCGRALGRPGEDLTRRACGRALSRPVRIPHACGRENGRPVCSVRRRDKERGNLVFLPVIRFSFIFLNLKFR
jgi:hypothetical protein